MDQEILYCGNASTFAQRNFQPSLCASSWWPFISPARYVSSIWKQDPRGFDDHRWCSCYPPYDTTFNNGYGEIATRLFQFFICSQPACLYLFSRPLCHPACLDVYPACLFNLSIRAACPTIPSPPLIRSVEHSIKLIQPGHFSSIHPSIHRTGWHSPHSPRSARTVLPHDNQFILDK